MSREVGRLDFGAVGVTVVPDGEYSFSAPNFFRDAPEAELSAALLQHGITDGVVVAPFHCLVVRTSGYTALIDAGLGAGPAPTVGHLRTNLAAAGIAPDSITHVVFSHGHYDHTGGAVSPDGSLAFPGARHLLCGEELRFWMTEESQRLAGPSRGPATRRKLEALSDHLALFEAGQEPLPGILAVAAPGHTPHNLALRIDLGAETLLYVADAVAHPIHLEHPDWYPDADLDPAAAVATRRRLLDEVAARGWLVAGYHMPVPVIGRVGRLDGGGYAWAPVG